VSEPVRFSVNGETCSMALDPDTPLIYVLRNDLKLTGTRLGCGGGECGCCSVLMDGRRIRSCETPLWGVAGKEITTIEGLSRDGQLHPLQQAFIDEQAAQCGYCVNGIIIAAASLLASNADVAEAEIRKHLDENLCRCGVHERMVRAVLRAAKAMKVKRSTSP
jgi:nicotinate dehydrogenase subunit A